MRLRILHFDHDLWSLGHLDLYRTSQTHEIALEESKNDDDQRSTRPRVEVLSSKFDARITCVFKTTRRSRFLRRGEKRSTIQTTLPRDDVHIITFKKMFWGPDVDEWIAENESSFSPPICNKLMSRDDLTIMFVGSPNTRTDFHVEEGARFPRASFKRRTRSLFFATQARSFFINSRATSCWERFNAASK